MPSSLESRATADPVTGSLRVGILHFTCPPIVGGVELLMGQHAELLLAEGHSVRVLAGRGGRFNPAVPVTLLPPLDSKHPALLAVNDELKTGEVSPRFDALATELLALLREHLAGLDVCIVHNALSLHFNLPLTAAFARLIAEGRAPLLVAWNHDLSWTNPLYTPLMREREPWSLLKTRLPGVRYVVVSEDRRQDLLRLWEQSAVSNRRSEDARSRPLTPETQTPKPASDPVVVPAGVSSRAKLRLRAATLQLVRQLRLDDGWPFMLLPARITKRKNIEYAIGVTRALRDLGLWPRLLVTGPPGPHNVRSVDYVDELQAERAQLDVHNEVIFLYEERRQNDPRGRFWTATDPMMDDLYQLADLLIFPSAQEGFGIPLLEAGLVRLPVFCSDIPPFREIAGDRVHRFALDAPPAETAARIAHFLETDPATRLRHTVLRQYAWERVYRERIAPLLVPPASVPADQTHAGVGHPPGDGHATQPEEPVDARRSPN
ncbi:MAG: glycosyltransferase family 4 protein [Chloroflexi bacterium]|nr:glycosyltransferase family 4 protein [Chloroflexota bacterium]